MKGISEAIGLRELLREILQVTLTIRIHVDASACKGMLLRHGTGKVKHLTTKQLWVQGAVQAYGMEVLKVPRAENSADILTLCSNPQQVEPEGSAQTLWPGRLLWVAGPLGQATVDGAETL